MSGKDEEFTWDKPSVSAALNDEQRAILEQRGVLDPAEIHRLASKTKAQVDGESKQAACHSELSDSDVAKDMQTENGVDMVQLGTREVSGVPDHDPLI